MVLPCPNLRHVVLYDLSVVLQPPFPPPTLLRLLTSVRSIDSVEIHGDPFLTWDDHLGLVGFMGEPLTEADFDILSDSLQSVRELKFVRTALTPELMCRVLQRAGSSKALKSFQCSDPKWPSPGPTGFDPSLPGLCNLDVGLSYVKDQIVRLDLNMKLTRFVGRLAYGPAGHLTVLRDLRNLQSLSISLQGLWGGIENLEERFLDARGWVNWDLSFPPDVLPPTLQHLAIYDWLPDMPDCSCHLRLHGDDCPWRRYYRAIKSMFWSLVRARKDSCPPRRPPLCSLGAVTWIPHPDDPVPTEGGWERQWQRGFSEAHMGFRVQEPPGLWPSRDGASGEEAQGAGW